MGQVTREKPVAMTELAGKATRTRAFLESHDSYPENQFSGALGCDWDHFTCPDRDGEGVVLDKFWKREHNFVTCKATCMGPRR